MKNKRIDFRSEAGFTLMELIVVIAIIAILIGLLLPQFNGMTDKANAVSASSDAKAALTALTSYTTSVMNSPRGSALWKDTKATTKMADALGISGFTAATGYTLTGPTLTSAGSGIGGAKATLTTTKGGLTFGFELDTNAGRITKSTCSGEAKRCTALQDEGIITPTTTNP